MKVQLLFSAIFFATIFSYLQETQGELSKNPRFIIDIIINAIKNQIKKLTNLVEKVIEDAIQEIENIKKKIYELVESAIKIALNAINSVIDDALGTIRKIAEDALDAGINITECYVKKIDDLNIIRRQLLIDEVKCATSQIGEFNNIIENAVHSFTDDLVIIGTLPNRLQECLTTINVVNCLTVLLTDIAALQEHIPQQILDTMSEISDYMITFEKRLHECQFDELRKAVDESRKVIDEVKFCVGNANNTLSVPNTAL